MWRKNNTDYTDKSPKISVINSKISVISAKGFTLIEMLIVSVVLAVVSLALYAVFDSGIKIWQKVNKMRTDEDVNIALSKFSRDVSNGLKYSGIDFSGGSEELRFAALLYSRQLDKRSIGEVTYSCHSGQLERRERDLSQIYNEQEGALRPLLKNLESCKFAYYIYDDQVQEYFWKENCEGVIPLAVRMELGYRDESETRSLSRTISIPVNK